MLRPPAAWAAAAWADVPVLHAAAGPRHLPAEPARTVAGWPLVRRPVRVHHLADRRLPARTQLLGGVARLLLQLPRVREVRTAHPLRQPHHHSEVRCGRDYGGAELAERMDAPHNMR